MADEAIQTNYSETDTESMAHVDSIMAALETDTATERPRKDNGQFAARETTESETPSDPVAGDEVDDAAPLDEASGEEAESEPESPAIEPPASWTAEAKETFSKLPPDLQKYVSERESEREKGINAKLSESANERKVAQAERESAAKERQRYAESLTNLYQLQAIIDPVLAEGNQTNWTELAKNDPAGYVQKWAAYQERANLMGAVQAEIQKVRNQQAQEAQSNYTKRLSDEFPEYANPETGKALKDSWAPVLKEVGFTPEQIEQGWSLPHEPKYLKLLDWAAKGLKAHQERQSIGSKKVANPPKVERPRAADTGAKGKPSNIVALEKRAKDSGRITDEADLILAMIANGKSR